MNEFKLFISGENDRTRKIIADIGPCLTAVFGKEYTLSVVDVITNPHIATQEGILATPTLVKVSPPKKKVFGNFTDILNILEQLGFQLPPDATD